MLLLVGAVAFASPQASDSALQRNYEEGEKALAEKRYADAETAYDKVRQLAPGTAEVYAKLGLIYYQQGKYEEAVKSLRHGLKLKPALSNADILLAMSLSELGQYREALPGLQKAYGRSTDPVLKRMAGLQLQRTYTGLQQDGKAVEIALQLSQLYPDDPEILYQTSKLFGNYAYLSMRRLAAVAPSSVWRHLAAGEVHESQGNHELAIAEYRQVLATDPYRHGIHHRIGRVLLSAKQGDFQVDAAKEFEEELKLDPTNANAAYELGEIRRKARQLDKARDLLEHALKYDHDFQEAHVALGRVLLAMGKPDAAVIHLKRATTLSPDDAVSYFHLANAYKAAGNMRDQQKALDEFKRLRSQALQQQEIGKQASSPREVTKQQLDSNSP